MRLTVETNGADFNVENPMQTAGNVIRLDRVVYRQSVTILQDVSWHVRRGEHWVIIGNNGSGKTTLLNVINGYVWPTKGVVEVLGQRFGEVDLRELRKSIGWVSAAFGDRVFASHPTDHALDVVASGKYASIGLYDTPDADDIAAARDLLDAFGAAELADRTYHTLSQGQKQRVLLARAWMAKPKLLILDEPCTGLDLLAREQLLTALERMADAPEAPTLLYVTHHPEEVLPLFTHALLMKNGRTVAEGAKYDVLTSEGLSETFGVQVEVSWADHRPWVKVVGGR
ncbi:ABC transporter ATP-binding protein [Alicyclobacillus cycloheptanicus]|uniref:Iron complex transport system ATP-binding protein n=1 Tax=Alicyclobacillus cycloheptanicus TaxID=1457 RepID=A0ABT9XEY8_9BACL|nr:ABC transporter ATP-binding protein [Alicyclobacillus cycloheptanicus]MDQ0188842.1 iron complex transport system ATP-binding protein [Alicyclobacillus cycloheptanicus]